MKVLIVSDATSVHTQRWVSSLKERGIDAVLYSIVPYTGDFYTQREITCHYFNLFNYKREKKGKLYPIKRHLEAIKDLKRVIKIENPDILHSHYLTSYSFIAALSGFHPFIASVWGSDIYDFPQQSVFNKLSIKFILGKADKILSTSNIMGKVVNLYTSKPVITTPFGVDSNKFFYDNTKYKESEIIKIGIVKTLAPKYGIDVLLKAFSILLKRNKDKQIELHIAGDGPNKEEYIKLASELDIANNTVFLGKIPNQQLPEYYHSFLVSVFPSVLNSESFGVVAVESMSCGCPVVTSDADGFTEVVENGVTGFIVPKYNAEQLADAVQKFIDNPKLRDKMGLAGRSRVCKLYNWDDNVQQMITIYKSVL